MTRQLGFVLISVAILGRPLAAQCPDGSPPPCKPARRATVAPAPNSIAVLYFDNLTHDSAFACLADGLTEDLITRLGLIARLDVKSSYESARLRGAHGLSPSDIGRELHVAYFVGGSVQPGSGRIRVNAELIEARSGRRVWGEGLTASGTDPLAVQESITTAVVQAVVGQLLPEERAALARRATRDSSAYDLYLRGRFFVSRLTEADLRQGPELYQEALIHDSTFAPAWAGIAWAWICLSDAWVPPLEAFAHVRQAAERALALDSSTALAYVALSDIAQQIDRDFARAETLARRAITLDPRLADAHANLSWILVNRGRPGEAPTESERAWQLDSLSLIVRQVRITTLELAGRASDALALARSMHMRPAEVGALFLLRRCAEAQDMSRGGRFRETTRTTSTWTTTGFNCSPRRAWERKRRRGALSIPLAQEPAIGMRRRSRSRLHMPHWGTSKKRFIGSNARTRTATSMCCSSMPRIGGSPRCRRTRASFRWYAGSACRGRRRSFRTDI